jgi:MFS transporter, AAHS family, 3-hydroxyphenylpropionic acid transporter
MKVARLPEKSVTILFCFLVALCEGIDLQAAGVAAAGIGAEFKPTANQFGTFFSASTFGLFFGALIGGRLADSIGRKRVLIVSIGVFGLFSLLTALAMDVRSLTWVRALTGLGLGGALPMVLALVTETSAARRQSATVATVYAAMPMGGAAASLLSMIVTTTQWRVVFVVGGVMPLLLVPLMAVFLPESRAFQRQHASIREVKAGSVIGMFTDNRARQTILLWFSFLLELLLLYLLLNWLPTLLVNDGFTKAEAAGAQIGFNLGGVLSAVLVGYLLGSRFRNSGIVAIFIMVPVLLVALAQAPADFRIVAPAVFVLGCGILAAQAFLYGSAPVIYPTRIRGIGVGAAVAFGRVGSIVGPKLGGALKAAGHGPSQLLMDLLPVAICGSVCALWLAWEVARRGRGTKPVDGSLSVGSPN